MSKWEPQEASIVDKWRIGKGTRTRALSLSLTHTHTHTQRHAVEIVSDMLLTVNRPRITCSCESSVAHFSLVQLLVRDLSISRHEKILVQRLEVVTAPA